MQLKFYARGDLLVTLPGFAPIGGQPLLRVGRDFVRGVYVQDDPTKSTPASYPATKEPFTVDSDSAPGRRLKKLIARDESLWAADKETAAECGVPFVELEFKDGSWVPKTAVSDKKPTNKGSE